MFKSTPAEPYGRNVKKGAETAAQEFGVNLSIISPNKPQTTEFVEDQIMLMANLIQTGEIDGVIIGPTDSIKLVAVVEKATRAGVPVITMDTPLNTEQILTFVGFDNFTAGKSMGKCVVKKLGGKGKVVILDGAPDRDNTIARRNGFIAGLNTGKIKILATASAKWNQAEAKNISAKWLKIFDEVDGIIALNDSMALEAGQAVKDAKYQEIIITGFDGLESGIQGIKKGEITATINQAPEKQARLAIQLMIRHLENRESYPNIVLLEDIKMIILENIENYYLSP
ncbi:MAG: sugar ABC transporter substrate-binding protein [Microcoleaceae cyanobacterium]